MDPRRQPHEAEQREAKAAQQHVEERRRRQRDHHLNGVKGEEDDEEAGEVEDAQAEIHEEPGRADERLGRGRESQAGTGEGRARRVSRPRERGEPEPEQPLHLEQHDRTRDQRRELVLVLLDEVHRLLESRHRGADRGVGREQEDEEETRTPEPGPRVPGQLRPRRRRRLPPPPGAERRDPEHRRDRHAGRERDRPRDLLPRRELAALGDGRRHLGACKRETVLRKQQGPTQDEKRESPPFTELFLHLERILKPRGLRRGWTRVGRGHPEGCPRMADS